jgi:transcriptional regulator with XRE-family HTH domain
VARRARRQRAKTRLAAIRIQHRITQAQLAEVTGLSVGTIRRLERGEYENPPVTYLLNCARALQVDLDELIEPQWQWTTFSDKAADPPAKNWWKSEQKPYRPSRPPPGRINRRRLAGLED